MQPSEHKPKNKLLQVTPVVVTNESLLIPFLQDNQFNIP